MLPNTDTGTLNPPQFPDCGRIFALVVLDLCSPKRGVGARHRPTFRTTVPKTTIDEYRKSHNWKPKVRIADHAARSNPPTRNSIGNKECAESSFSGLVVPSTDRAHNPAARRSKPAKFSILKKSAEFAFHFYFSSASPSDSFPRSSRGMSQLYD